MAQSKTDRLNASKRRHVKGEIDCVGTKRDGQNPSTRSEFVPSQKAPQIYSDSPTTIF